MAKRIVMMSWVYESASKDDIKKLIESLLLNIIQIRLGDKTSEEKFKEASEAYHILSDEKEK